ncbi:hypothetical protein QUA40_25110 [Microcoleus sp. Pol11C3]
MRWAIRWSFTSAPDKLVTPEVSDQLQPLLVANTLLAIGDKLRLKASCQGDFRR